MQQYVVRNLTNIPVDAMGNPEPADRIEAWLQARGFQTDGISAGRDPVTGTVTVIATTDTDPSSVLTSYTSAPTPREVFRANALADARPVIAAIIAKDRATRTPAERALLGLAVLVKEAMID
jgi:hypothetical protein